MSENNSITNRVGLDVAQNPGPATRAANGSSISNAKPLPAICSETGRILNAMTVDVEDYFQVSAFEPYIPRSSWGGFEYRVEANVDRILELFDNYSVKGTFFTLGWIAENFPAMTRRITDQGHEMASHGSEHVMVTKQTRDQFLVDVSESRDILEQVAGQRVLGFRAPSYSINETNLWAHDVLREAGYTYSSSIAPIKHDLYGMPDAPRFAHLRSDGSVLEVPITTVRIGQRNVPCGGGGWFRLYPYSVSRWAINKVNVVDGEAGVFYFHPWEIDPAQPRQSQVNRKTQFRHYVNLGSTYDKVENLLKDFAWDRMDNIFNPEPPLS